MPVISRVLVAFVILALPSTAIAQTAPKQGGGGGGQTERKSSGAQGSGKSWADEVSSSVSGSPGGQDKPGGGAPTGGEGQGGGKSKGR